MAKPSNTSQTFRNTGSQGGIDRRKTGNTNSTGRTNVCGSIQKSEIKLRSAK